MAIVAAKSAVTAPTSDTICCASGTAEYNGAERVTRYTPAVTIVAAWISAETGVGPAIASGNHTYKGICADLPVTPISKNKVIATINPSLTSWTLAKTASN
ncbi:MAG: hypothetical protein JFAIHJKO_01900 [Pyrinomonadaceae bacterium]|nr:hypothetical protein [Pyrinomonadaceae bacterium]